MNTSIITLDYDSTPVFFHSDAFINATAIAGKFNKLPKDYLKTSRTKEYIDAVRRILLTEENQIVKVVQGGTPEEQGTWLHPKLAIDFARWLSADFAVWCDLQIEKILHPVQHDLPSPTSKPAQIKSLMAEGYVVSPVDQLIVRLGKHMILTAAIKEGYAFRQVLVTPYKAERAAPVRSCGFFVPVGFLWAGVRGIQYPAMGNDSAGLCNGY